MIATTSATAYTALRRDGTLSRQQGEIVGYVRPGALYTRRELSRLSGLEVNVISGRVNELLAAGVLVVDGVKVCPISGRTVEAVKLAARQMELIG